MKKCLLIACVIGMAMIANSGNAQSLTGTSQVGFSSKGLLSKTIADDREPNRLHVNIFTGYSGWGIPIGASVEVPLPATNISLVATGTFQTKKEDYGYLGYPEISWRHTLIGFQGGINYYLDNHFPDHIDDNVDVFVSGRLNYINWETKIENENNGDEIVYAGGDLGGVGFNFTAGGRYHVKENFGIFAEVGYGSLLSSLRAGISLTL
ncbi:MAG: hypothetical protein ACPGED_02890 [Flavobacteriales bacterium]